MIDERTARESSEEQAVQLLREAFGAEKIDEVDAALTRGVARDRTTGRPRLGWAAAEQTSARRSHPCAQVDSRTCSRC